MNKKKKWKYLKNRESARWLYKNTGCSIAMIARHLNLSHTTIDHMVTGKGEPKWFNALKVEQGAG